MAKRYLLKLTKVVNSTSDLSGIAEEYFADYYYDPASMGCWFLTMDDALYARKTLEKEHRYAVYDVLSYESPWKEAMEQKEKMAKTPLEVSNDAPVPGEDFMFSGDNDSDNLDKFLAEMCPVPLATGRSAITIAKAGVGELCFTRNNMRIPVNMQEAEALVKLCPSDIHLYAKEGQE